MFDNIIVLSACSDVDKFQEGISNKIGNFFQSISTFILGFIIGFVYGWKLCLVILAVSPLLVFSGIFMTHVSKPATSRRRNLRISVSQLEESGFETAGCLFEAWAILLIINSGMLSVRTVFVVENLLCKGNVPRMLLNGRRNL